MSVIEKKEERKIHLWNQYYFISDRSFGLVWPNIIIYVISHAIYAFSALSILFYLEWNIRFFKVFLFCKSILCIKSK